MLFKRDPFVGSNIDEISAETPVILEEDVAVDEYMTTEMERAERIHNLVTYKFLYLFCTHQYIFHFTFVHPCSNVLITGIHAFF